MSLIILQVSSFLNARSLLIEKSISGKGNRRARNVNASRRGQQEKETTYNKMLECKRLETRGNKRKHSSHCLVMRVGMRIINVVNSFRVVRVGRVKVLWGQH